MVNQLEANNQNQKNEVKELNKKKYLEEDKNDIYMKELCSSKRSISKNEFTTIHQNQNTTSRFYHQSDEIFETENETIYQERASNCNTNLKVIHKVRYSSSEKNESSSMSSNNKNRIIEEIKQLNNRVSEIESIKEEVKNLTAK